ncbi:MAG: heavy-metal-associated domain-containing protein [Planctomycetes bacterium]|nr:heavy-metal-associated domain-containing protein [Planctomycetota bacterium]
MFHAWKFSLLILMAAAPRALAEGAAAPAAEAASPVETTLKIDKTDTVIYVGDLHCKTCAKKIARKLYAVKGVVKVRADVKANVAVVTPQAKKTLNVKALWAAARKAGFPPLKLVGPTGAFEPDPKTKTPVRVPEQVASKR